MGIGLNRRFTAVAFLVSSFAALASGTPRLGLTQTALGPISVSAGSNGPTQTLVAQNLGDGQLSVSALADVPWLAATVGPSSGCLQVGGQCFAVHILLNTSSLAKGTYTGTVTFTAPNALDSPQTVTVTVAVGGSVPDQLTFYVPANGSSVTQSFKTSTRLTSTVTSPANGPALAVAMSGGGSFATTATYNVSATSRAGVAEGSYNGSIAFSGSSVAAENKTVPVAMTVTSQPIASAVAPVRLRIAQGAAKQTSYYAVSNLGAGTLNLSGATAATTSGGDWLTGSIYASYVGVTVDPSKLAPGSYQGTITVASNAANATTVPVQVDVVAAGPPLAYAGGVVSNADFAPGPLAPGDLPALFGEQFTNSAAQSAPSLPLPTTLGGATVLINNNAVPIYYVSAGQINFQIPYEVALGDAVLRVDRDGQRGNDVYLRINRTAPRLHSATNAAYTKVAAAGVPPLAPVKRGDDIVLWVLGLGPTSPAVASGSGAPTSPLATVSPKPDVLFGSGSPDTGGITVTPDFVGLTPGFVGLYQINLRIPQPAPTGSGIPVYLKSTLGFSNQLLFNIQ